MKPYKVYVAGRYSAKNVLDVARNIGRGKHAVAKLFEMGYAPYDPWADFSYITDNPDGKFNLEMFYAASLVWMESADAVFVISGNGDGGGVDKEIDRAIELCIPVFYSILGLNRWRERNDLKLDR